MPSVKASPAYNTIIQVCIIGILVYSPLVLGANRLWAVTPVYIMTLCAACSLLLRINAQGAVGLRSTPLAAPLAAFFVLSCASFITSSSRHDSMLELYRIMTYGTLYYLIVNSVDSKRAMGRLVGVITGMGALLSLSGIVLYFGHIYYQYWQPGVALSSTYVNRNHFAGYLEMALPLAAGFFFTNMEKAKKALVGFLVILMAVAFVLTCSRGAWISLAASCLLIVPFLYRAKALKKILLAVIVCGIVLYLALAQFDLAHVTGRARSIIEGVGVDDARIQTWIGAAGLVQAHPFAGWGIGTFIRVFPTATVRPSGDYRYSLIDYAHNDYLQMTVELGLAGLVLMLCVIAGALWAGLREFRTSRGSFKRSILMGACIGVASMALHSFVDFNLHIPANAILFATLIAIIMTMRGRRRYD